MVLDIHSFITMTKVFSMGNIVYSMLCNQITVQKYPEFICRKHMQHMWLLLHWTDKEEHYYMV